LDLKILFSKTEWSFW